MRMPGDKRQVISFTQQSGLSFPRGGTLLRAVRKMCPRSHGRQGVMATGRDVRQLQMATGRDVRQLTDHDVTQEQPDQALERGMWRGDEI